MNTTFPKSSTGAVGSCAIDLTGPNSHTLKFEVGVGGLAIGPSILKEKVNLHVEQDECIDWSVFNNFLTPAGSPWPRQLDYIGNDHSFFDWARNRPIEQMSWYPVFSKDIAVDASDSKIRILYIKLKESSGQLHLTLPMREVSPYFHLSVCGDLTRFTSDGGIPYMLELAPSTCKSKEPYQLPNMGALSMVNMLELRNEPMAQPISLKCLDYFPNLEYLSLWGNFTHLGALTNQAQLKTLELRFMPNITDLPALNFWPQLNSFIAYNVEEAAGRRLRQQLKARSNIRQWEGYASVSHLRKPEWWVSEFGRPFSAWRRNLAKVANKAYDSALTALASAQTIDEGKAAFMAFIVHFNGLKGIETTERDDLGEAVWHLCQSTHAVRLGIMEEMAQQWFDDARDY